MIGVSPIPLFDEGEIHLYEEIFNAWKREKNSEVIQSLPADFFQRASEYLSDLKASFSKEGGESGTESAAKREIEYVEFMLLTLLRMRAKKIASLFLVDSAEIPPQLQEDEVALVKSLRVDFERYLQQCLRPSQSVGKALDMVSGIEEPTLVNAKETSNSLLLRILQPIPKLVGIDLDEYGPFQQEDLVLLPKENALVLIARGAASEVRLTRSK